MPTEPDRAGVLELGRPCSNHLYRGIGTDEGALIYKTSKGTYKLRDLDRRMRVTRQVWYSEQRLRAHTPRLSNRALDLNEPYLYAAVH